MKQLRAGEDHQRRMKLAYCLFLALPLLGQAVSVGVIGGIPITEAVKIVDTNQNFNFENQRRFVVGPTVQINLPARFGIEIDGLYRSVGYDFDNPTFRIRTRANSWEIPLMAKFEILPGPIRPFIQGGANFRYISGISRKQQVISTGAETDQPLDLDGLFQTGFTFGGGVAFKFGRVRISPQVRYTHWGEENLRDPLNSFLRVNSNQGDFLVALTF
jgi:hypothetical protein